MKVHTPRGFVAVVNREKDRSDRTGKEFAVVVFQWRSQERRRFLRRNLASILLKRIRSTDDIGWLEDGRLAVILPHTSPDNAWNFVDTVYQALGKEAILTDCQVYSYPFWEFDQDREGGGEGSRGEGPSSGEGRSGGDRKVAPWFSETGVPIGKRAFDIACSIGVAIVLTPLLIGVAVLIKAVSPGPVLFRQMRLGRNGRLFPLWKFRTMHVNAETGVHEKHLRALIRGETRMTKLDNRQDSRIIPFGGVLRATGIDELPQLLNVLRGEMSLIGPRPCLPYEAKEFDPWQMRRFDTLPGLTGLWQVSGKNRTTFKEMMRLDIRYSREMAPALDLKIFLKTVPAVAGQLLDRPGVAAVVDKAKGVARAGSEILSLLPRESLRK